MNMDGGKLHPAQKPIEVMRWCVSQLPDNAEVILDPYMGSGSTGCAAVDVNAPFIGIKGRPKYYGIARRRITKALSQPRLAFPKPVKVRQESLLSSRLRGISRHA